MVGSVFGILVVGRSGASAVAVAYVVEIKCSVVVDVVGGVDIQADKIRAV